jgi:5-amino-6-(5-phosphoribosylamino)uracil reductase
VTEHAAPSRRPYVLLSAAMSADGYIDDAAGAGLSLSDAADWDRVDELRAAADAIMAGAQTIRANNPRLRVKDATRQQQRIADGGPPHPRRVTLTSSGNISATAEFFAAADELPLVYAGAAAAGPLAAALAGRAEVVAAPGPRVGLDWLLADLAGRGIGRLMVEGGSAVLGQFLAAGLADELQLAVAPVLIADPAAPRLLAGPPPAGRMALAGVSQAGDMAVLRYLRPG